jgi:hypothetical protein
MDLEKEKKLGIDDKYTALKEQNFKLKNEIEKL